MIPDASSETGASPPSRRPRWLTITARVVPYLLVGVMLVYVFSRREDLERLSSASWRVLALIAVLVIVGAAMNASEFWLLYRAADVPIGFRENWALFNAGQLGNYLPMQLGTVYRFRYLKSVHGLRYANTASFLAMNLVITLGSTALCGLGGLAVLWWSGDARTSYLLIAVFVAMIAVAVLSAFVPLPATARSGRLAAAWVEFHTGWETIRRRPMVALQVLIIDAVKLVLLAFRFAIAFEILDVHAPIGVYVVIAPVTALVSAVAPTPGSLGIREGAVAVVSGLLGYSVPTGLLAATIDRGVMLVVSLVLGGAG
jgi:uncharacterized membrane protein YbhN (UPF0104 family)